VITLTNRYTGSGNPQEFASEVWSCWEKDSHVIEASCPAWLRRGPRNFNQFQQWLFILTAKDNLTRLLLDRLESEYPFVKAPRALKI